MEGPVLLRSGASARSIGVWLLLLPLAGFGQESRGTIAGSVADPHGAAIPAVRVVITNTETGVATALETNAKGAYFAPLLIPGVYRVTAEHSGFKRATRQNVRLSVDDSLQVDFALEL